jgi:hypothetical protein
VDGAWVKDYVFVDWGELFRARHSEALPDLETPAISLIENQTLLTMSGTPSLQRPAYVVYASTARDPLKLRCRGCAKRL